MENLAIIPARGGSKGVPGKNIRSLGGVPLIGHTLRQALDSRMLTRVVVSTDDPNIASVSRSFGAEVIDRPTELATDTAKSIDAILHTIDALAEEGYIPETVTVLQPTSPLRSSKDIDTALEMFLASSDALSLVSVTEFDHPPFWSMKLEDGMLEPMFGDEYFRMRRQELPRAYRPNGAIFISRVDVLRREMSFYTPRTMAYVMPPERSIDIDTEMDFALAEFFISRKGGPG